LSPAADSPVSVFVQRDRQTFVFPVNWTEEDELNHPLRADKSAIHLYLQNGGGRWDLSSDYDLTFSPHPFNERSMGFQGCGEWPPVELLGRYRGRASYASPAKSRVVKRDIIEVVSKFEQIAGGLGISKPIREEIARRLDAQCEHYASGIWLIGATPFSVEIRLKTRETFLWLFLGFEFKKLSEHPS
jgi:hypothetical protein